MICPLCGNRMNNVDTWNYRGPYIGRLKHPPPDDPGLVRRRKVCRNCDIKFITEEKIVRQL